MLWLRRLAHGGAHGLRVHETHELVVAQPCGVLADLGVGPAQSSPMGDDQRGIAGVD